MKNIKAVIFDWAGTTVDFGCQAPAVVFAEAFAEAGIAVSAEEVRSFMGLPKLDHTEKLFGLASVQKQFRERYGRVPDINDVHQVYARLAPKLETTAARYAQVITGIPELLAALRAAGISIGSCTGYTCKMMDHVAPVAAQGGFIPDAMVVPEDVGAGRPAPNMIFENLRRMGIDAPASHCVKIGDTVADIEEGCNAGCWNIAWTCCGNEMGLSEEELMRLPEQEFHQRNAKIRRKLYAAGADYVVNFPQDVYTVLAEISQRIEIGDTPGEKKRPGQPGKIDLENIPENPYLLLTPGPLSTSKGVRAAALRDWCTWDSDYNNLTQDVRRQLLTLAETDEKDYAAILMQGSGTFGLEGVIGTIPQAGAKLLVLSNGHYGQRIAQIAEILHVPFRHVELSDVSRLEAALLEQELAVDSTITHVAFVHCETTTGILNPLEELAPVVKAYRKTLIVDAMSSFGGIPIQVAKLGIDFLISSANKCIQGIPGFSFILAKRTALKACGDETKSLSLDICGQFETMEKGNGKWRFTSPTHVVRAFHQALRELDAEGGVAARCARYTENQQILAQVMSENGFQPLLPAAWQSPIITSFYYPSPDFKFTDFYEFVKQRGFVLYPGKISQTPTFRVGNIGEVYPKDMLALGRVIAEYEPVA